MESINIEQIMEEIRAEIKEKGYKESDLSFRDIPIRDNFEMEIGPYDRKDCIDALMMMSNSSTHDINIAVSGHSTFALFIKKTIRKMTKFLFYPVLTLQNEYNLNNVRFCMQIKAHMEELEEELKKKEMEIEELKQKLQDVQNM